MARRHGVQWAFDRVREGDDLYVARRELLLVAPAKEQGDSYEIAWSDDRVIVTAGSAVGTISGLLEVARQVASAAQAESHAAHPLQDPRL